MTRSHLCLRAKPGRRDELLRVLNRVEVRTAASEQPGFLAAEIQLPFEDPDRVLVWSSWASREHYERWRSSVGCEELLQELNGLVAEEPESRVYHVVDAFEAV